MEVDGKPISPRFFQVPFAVELDNATGAWLQTHFNGPLRLKDQEQVLALYGTLQGPDSTLIPPDGVTRLERESIGSATVRYDSPALGTITPAARFESLMALRYTPSKLEPESLEALMDFSNLSNLSEDGQQLADSALMVLGEVARNTEDGAVTSRLTQALSTAASDQRRLIALNALANAGDETTVPLLGDYLSAGNATVRARAAEALGGIPTAQARALLQGQLQDGNPPAVRAAALEGLGKQTLDAGEVAALTRLTAPEEPLPVRRSALAALAA